MIVQDLTVVFTVVHGKEKSYALPKFLSSPTMSFEGVGPSFENMSVL